MKVDNSDLKSEGDIPLPIFYVSWGRKKFFLNYFCAYIVLLKAKYVSSQPKTFFGLRNSPIVEQINPEDYDIYNN